LQPLIRCVFVVQQLPRSATPLADFAGGFIDEPFLHSIAHAGGFENDGHDRRQISSSRLKGTNLVIAARVLVEQCARGGAHKRALAPLIRRGQHIDAFFERAN
jgi:hypothetical protein